MQALRILTLGVLLLGGPTSATANDVRVLAAGVFGTSLRALAAPFKSDSGADIQLTVANAGKIAAKLLDVNPVRCVALEDSPNGAASATAAGCRVVAVPSFGEMPEAPGRLIVGSLRDVSLGTLRDLAQDAQGW